MIVQLRQWGFVCLLTIAGATFAQTDRLLEGGQMSFRVDYAEYYVQRGGVRLATGSYSQAPARIVFDPGTLSFSVPLNRLVNAFDSEAAVNYVFEQQDEDYIWISEPLAQSICTTFSIEGVEYRFRIDSVFSFLFAGIESIEYQSDPLGALPCVSTRVNFASVFTILGFRGYFIDEACNPVEQGSITLVWYDATGYGGGRPGDVNCDDCVDDADLLAVLFAFGSNDPAADLNSDGIVKDEDLLIVIARFGSGCS